jgi:DNA-binding MarR family transcriptional regulator
MGDQPLQRHEQFEVDGASFIRSESTPGGLDIVTSDMISSVTMSPNDPNDILEVRLVRTFILCRQLLADVAARHDLDTVDWHLLLHLDHAGPSTQIDLGRRTLRDPMGVSRLVRALEVKGLVARYEDPGDSRAKRVALTSEGQRRIRAIQVEFEAAQPFSSAERAVLTATFADLEDRLRDACDRRGVPTVRGPDRS